MSSKVAKAAFETELLIPFQSCVEARRRCPGLPPIADAASSVDADVMSEDNFSWLSRWYLSHCDDEWEHAYGVRIDTLDNPGWSLKIDLTATSLQDKAFEGVTQGEPSDDLKGWHRTGSWWIASVQNGQFEAFCGPLDLSAAIGVFRRWADETAKH